MNDDYIHSVQYSDVRRFDELLADDFLCSDSAGALLDRRAFLEHTAQPVPFTDLTVHDVNVRLLGNFAIIHARTTYNLRDGGAGASRYTDVWARVRAWLAGLGADHEVLGECAPSNGLHQLRYVRAIRHRQRGALDGQDVFGAELRRCGRSLGAGDHGVVHTASTLLCMKSCGVSAGRRRALADELGAGDDVARGGDFLRCGTSFHWRKTPSIWVWS